MLPRNNAVWPVHFGGWGWVSVLGLVAFVWCADARLFGQSSPKPTTPKRPPEIPTPPPGPPSAKKVVPDLDDIPSPLDEAWRVVPSVTETTGTAKARFLIYNVHTAESYVLDNTMSEWHQLVFHSPKTTNLKQGDSLLPIGGGSSERK